MSANPETTAGERGETDLLAENARLTEALTRIARWSVSEDVFFAAEDAETLRRIASRALGELPPLEAPSHAV